MKFSIMKERFGVLAHTEWYRAGLSRMRRGTMSVEQLHHKFRSFVSKAAPGPWTPLTGIYARDAFLASLDDSDLMFHVDLPATGDFVGRL